MFGEIGQHRRLAVALDVIRRTHHHTVIGREFGGDQVGILQVGDADRKVNPLVFQIHDALSQLQRDIEIGMRGNEGRQVRCNVLAAERSRRRHNQPSAGTSGAGGQRFLCRAQFIEDVSHILVERHAFRRQGNLARRALEQLYAKQFFKLINAPSDHRGRDALVARNRRQTLGLGDVQKRLQCF